MTGPKSTAQNGSFNSRIHSTLWASEFSPYDTIAVPNLMAKPTVSVALSGAGGADGSLKTADSGSAGFGHSRSLEVSAMYGRMLLNKYSWRCTDRPVGGTVGGILLFNKLSEITNSVQTEE